LSEPEAVATSLTSEPGAVATGLWASGKEAGVTTVPGSDKTAPLDYGKERFVESRHENGKLRIWYQHRSDGALLKWENLGFGSSSGLVDLASFNERGNVGSYFVELSLHGHGRWHVAGGSEWNDLNART
jgi:hypothetical protein